MYSCVKTISSAISTKDPSVVEKEVDTIWRAKRHLVLASVFTHVVWSRTLPETLPQVVLKHGSSRYLSRKVPVTSQQSTDNSHYVKLVALAGGLHAFCSI